ncbi:hypothetical protein QUC31_010446 [Theobroma cacao]
MRRGSLSIHVTRLLGQAYVSCRNASRNVPRNQLVREIAETTFVIAHTTLPWRCVKSMGKKSAMAKFLVMVLAMLELAATNVLNPSKAVLELALKLSSTVSLVNVPGLAASDQ